jgi:hypothetical protein
MRRPAVYFEIREMRLPGLSATKVFAEGTDFNYGARHLKRAILSNYPECARRRFTPEFMKRIDKSGIDWTSNAN